MSARKLTFAVATLVGWLAAACSDGGGGPASIDPCAEITCGEDALCVVAGDAALCACVDGYVKLDGECVAVPESPCEPNPCTESHRRLCVADTDGAGHACYCDPGYLEAEGGGCEPVAPDLCDPNPCEVAGQTTCALIGDEAVCLCNAGYVDDGQSGCEPAPVDPCEPNPCDAPQRTVCAVIDGAAACLCEEGYLDDGQGGCAAWGSFEVGSHAEPDPAAYVDWFSFEVEAQHMYQIRAQGEDTGILLSLYAPDGTTLLESDSEDYSYTAFIDRGALEPGTYYLRVREDYGSTATGPYSVWVTDLGTDDHGDAPETATGPLATDGTPTSGVFEVGSYGEADAGAYVDWFYFVVEEGHLYQLRAQGESTGMLLSLYGPDGSTLLESDSEDYSYTAFIDRGALEPGTYYLRVREDYGSTATGPYQIWVTDIGLDDHGDDAATAAGPLLTDGTPMAGVFEVGSYAEPTAAAYVDWFTFDTEAGHLYQIRAQGDGTGMLLTLYGPDGESVIESDSADYSATAFIDRGALDAGTYFIRVREDYGSTATGSYQVWVTDLGTDDHGDTPETATGPLPADGTKTGGVFEVGSYGETIAAAYVDWFSFDVIEGHLYQIRAQGTGSGVVARLYGPDGTTLIETGDGDYSSAMMIDRGALAAGTYYLRLQEGYGNTSTGAYDVWIVDLGTDDHGDDAQSATGPLPTDGTKTAGSFEVGSAYEPDAAAYVDWFSFDVIAGHLYQIWAQGQGSGIEVRLYWSDGTTLLETADGSYSSAALIDRDDLAAGRHYLRVREDTGNTATGPYEVWIVDLGENDHGTDAASASGPLPTDGTKTAGSFEVAGNVDWFYFDAVEGASYTLRGAGTSTGMALQLYDATGATQLGWANASYSSTATLVWTAALTGPYALRVASYTGSTKTGPYEVWITSP